MSKELNYSGIIKNEDYFNFQVYVRVRPLLDAEI